MYDVLSTEINNTRHHPGGEFVLSVPSILGDNVAGRWVWEYMLTNPGVSISLNSINAGCLSSDSPAFDDLVIKSGYIDSADLIHKKLKCIPFGIYASPEYLLNAADITVPGDLDFHPVLKMEHPELVPPLKFQRDDGVMVDHYINSHMVFESNNVNSIIHLALKGRGIGLGIPQWLADNYVKKGELVQLIPEWTLLELPCYMVWRYRKHYTFSFQDFIQYVEQQWNLFFNSQEKVSCD